MKMKKFCKNHNFFKDSNFLELNHYQRVFTLIELLMVIAAIAILSALLLPALKKAKDRAKGIVCLGNLRTIGLATHTYANDYNGFLAPINPPSYNPVQDPYTSSVFTGAPNRHHLGYPADMARGLGLLVRGSYLPIMTHTYAPSSRFSLILMCPSEREKNKRDFPCAYATDAAGRDYYIWFSSYHYMGGLKYTPTFVKGNNNAIRPRNRVTDWPGACIARDAFIFVHGSQPVANTLFLDGSTSLRHCKYADYLAGFRSRPFED